MKIEQKLTPEKNSHMSDASETGTGRHKRINFDKAATKLEPPPPSPTLFKLLGFRASFVTCNAYYESVFCGLPNNKMIPNDIHANQTTSFVRIHQWKLQAVSIIFQH